jgi:IS30 family transposase
MGYKHLTREQRYTIEAPLPYKDKIHTITAVGGKEFARHKEIAKGLDAEFYFARPYHTWERGANENTNGLIRQYIPKGTDFSELTDEMLAEIEWKLNHRPRKSLGYRTPLEYL